MIRWTILLGICAATLAIAGCGDGVGITRRERADRHRRIAEMDARQFNDDWDLFWLNDDVLHLSPWRIR